MIGKTISHYKVLEKLGEGGMGVVYRAEDTRLKRPVALKFLKHEAVGDSVEKKRFLHEAQAAARLDHSNICSVYEVDHIVGQSFIAMAYVDGQSLKDRLEGGPLAIEEVIGIARQINEGLNEAHEKGIVHRDIKPANIMLTTKNQVKIMDFGLAKLSGMTRVTKTGSTIGTMAYMSPEQARGEEVGRSTDIWSFGVVLYEMLTGRLPFQGEYDAAVLYSILNRELDSVSTLRPDTPRNLQLIIGKALEKEPADRYLSMAEILADLKETKPITEPESKKSIIVLPFVNMSPDPDQEYFSDGLTEEIITDLSHVGDLLVISRNSAMTFKGTKKRTSEIARTVNVRYVLEGSVRKAGNNLRITAQLIDATTDAHLWAEKYRGTLDDIFDIQEEVSRSIVDALKLKLTSEETKRITERPINNAEAYECYLHAKREIYRGTEDGLHRALRDLLVSIDMVGENAILIKGMAEVYLQFYEYGVKADEETLLDVEKYANKLIELQPDSDDSYYLLGRIERYRGSVSGAAAFFKKAYTINPDNRDAMLFLANAYGMQIGKTRLADQLLTRLLEIDPLNPLFHACRGMSQTLGGQFDLAFSTFDRFSKLEPDDVWANLFRTYIYAFQNRYDKVFDLVERMMVQKSPGRMYDTLTGWCLFFKYALQGEKTKALDTVTEEVKEFFWNDPEVMWMGICNYALIDEKHEAINWLEHIINRGWINYTFLNERIRFLENIRGEPRFKKLMERVKYEWEHFEV